VKHHANLRLNGCDGADGVNVYDVALDDRDGLMKLHVSDGDSTASIAPPNESGNETPEDGWVQAHRLDGFHWAGRFA
jgi:hypothetical protein